MVLIFRFVTRTILIRYLGEKYLGINGLFSNILSVLSLAELGIGNAIVYEMYEPIAKKNYEKLYSLVELYKKLYLIIAAIISLIGIMIIPLLIVVQVPPCLPILMLEALLATVRIPSSRWTNAVLRELSR